MELNSELVGPNSLRGDMLGSIQMGAYSNHASFFQLLWIGRRGKARHGFNERTIPNQTITTVLNQGGTDVGRAIGSQRQISIPIGGCWCMEFGLGPRNKTG